MRLEDYLIRIGYEGNVQPDLDCLTRIHRCHALSVPYENLDVQLERINDGYWRFHNHSFGIPTTFDFRPEAADETLIARTNHELQTSPDAIFVQNFVAQIMRENSITCLTGKVMRDKTSAGTTKTILSSAKELEHTLVEVFGIEDPEIQSIWPRIQARHAVLFGDQTLDQIDVSEIEF